MDNVNSHPHRRYNSLTGEWILVSPHRTLRPWQGQVHAAPQTKLPQYDPSCYLCPGNTRAGNAVNPHYTKPYVFTNDFSALLPNTPATSNNEPFFVSHTEQGICKVMCFSPRHDLTIPQMEQSDIEQVIHTWIEEYISLSHIPYIHYIQIFENKGSIMGCSNPHPHCQIWASQSIPVEVVKEQTQQETYYTQHNTTLLSDYIKAELQKQERIVIETKHMVVLVPFWAVWPFETMIVSKRPIQHITELLPEEIQEFAAIYKELTIRYDNIFNTSFPYSAGLHQAPCDGNEHKAWHMHMHFYPPLLRSAEIKKFMVGYEMLANPQRDITPEQAAHTLRSASTIHYTQNS